MLDGDGLARPTMRRRRFLAGGTFAASSAAASRFARAGDTLLQQLSYPIDLATPLPYFDRLITPAAVFFVRSHFPEPALDPRRRLRIEGAKTTLELDAFGLHRRFKEVTVTAVLQCAGNSRSLHNPRVPGLQWGHGAMGQATWTGVRLGDLLESAGLPDGAAHVRLLGADRPPQPTVPRFIRSIPLARALDPTTIVATKMNGAPLTLVHGAPMRLCVPGWTGQHWVKWLSAVRAQKDEAEGFYYQTGYRMPKQPVAPGSAVKPSDMTPLQTFPIRSVIARPVDGAIVPSSALEIVGVAFSGEAELARVEVSVDGGTTWSEARREGAPGLGRWQLFRHRPAGVRPGPVRVAARATDSRGAIQPRVSSWNPSGYVWNGWHEVNVTVTA